MKKRSWALEVSLTAPLHVQVAAAARQLGVSEAQAVALLVDRFFVLQSLGLVPGFDNRTPPHLHKLIAKALEEE